MAAMASPFSGALQLTDLDDFIGPSQVGRPRWAAYVRGGLRGSGSPILSQFLPLRSGIGTQKPRPVPPGLPALWPGSY